MTQRPRAFAIFTLFLLAGGVAGCSGSGNSPTAAPTPAPTAAPTVRAVVASGNGRVPVRDYAFFPFTTTANGTLDIAVDWTLAVNDVNVYLMFGSCTSFEQFNAGQCTVASSSVSTVLKPERVTFIGASAGAYTLWIGNVGSGAETVSFEVVLTTQGLRGQ